MEQRHTPGVNYYCTVMKVTFLLNIFRLNGRFGC